MAEQERSFTPDLRQETSRVIDEFHNYEVQEYQAGNKPEILKHVENGEVSKEQLVQIMKTRYQAAHFFEDMLRRIIQKINSSTVLNPEAKQALAHSVQVNLDEELGMVKEYGGPHIEGREELLTALGVDYKAWLAQLGDYANPGNLEASSRELIERMKGIIDQDPVQGVAALYEYEDRISLDGSGDYYMLLKGLEKVFPQFKKDKYVEGDVFWHVASHADHDEHHAQLAKDGLVIGINNQDDLQRMKSALAETRKAIDNFWKNLQSETEKS